MASSVFNGSSSAFGGGSGGRSFGSFRLTNTPQDTDFGRYLDGITDPLTKASLGMQGYAENEGTTQNALNWYRQFLAEGGGSPAMLRAFDNKQQALRSAYGIRQAEQPNTRLADFLRELDAQGSWQNWGQYEAGRQSPMQRIRFSN